VAKRHDPEIFEVLVGQLSNDAFIDVVFDKAFRDSAMPGFLSQSA